MNIYALILRNSGAAFTAGPLADVQAAIQLDRVTSLEVSWRWPWPGFWSHDECYCSPCRPGCSGRTAVSKVFNKSCLNEKKGPLGVREFNELDFTLKVNFSFGLLFPFIHANCSKFLGISRADYNPIKSEWTDSIATLKDGTFQSATPEKISLGSSTPGECALSLNRRLRNRWRKNVA